jgi:hypothetical protein
MLAGCSARRLGCVVAFGVAIGVLVLILLVLIVWMAQPSQPKLRFGQSPFDHEAEAAIEDSDIDQMIEARSERRRRLGKPDIGDELEGQLQNDLRRSR